jgi:hypothetical protein
MFRCDSEHLYLLSFYLQGTKSYLEKSIKESEDNLREMVTSRQQAK